MRYPMKRTALSLSTAVLLLTLSACGTEGDAMTAAGGSTAQVFSSLSISDGADAASPRAPATLDLTGATTILFSGGEISIEGDGAEVADGVVIITAPGTYAVSDTVDDGRIVIDAPDADVTVALNGADITCSYGSPLYIYQAGAATVHLMEGTENALTDGTGYSFADSYSSEADEEPNACLYSRADLVIEGAGDLTVTANYDNGITSKGALEIYDGAISVTAIGHGINGKGSNTIASAALTVECGGDAIRSTSDTDDALGWVSISDSTLDLTAGEDGIQAETSLTLSSGSYTIVSGGGSGAQPAEDASAKGIKAGTSLRLEGGTYVLDCSDDALHANGDVTVSGGVYTISTGDDALHADGALAVSGGDMEILTSYEGLEGATVSISGGAISLVSTDDGVNAAGGADGSGYGALDPADAFESAGGSYYIEISGGDLRIQAGGDGLDANGSITLSGGTVLVASSGQADGALDCEGAFTLSGGTLLALSSGTMSQTPSGSGQYAISVSFDPVLSTGTYVGLTGETQDFVFQLPIDTRGFLFSSPELESGATYTVSYGGAYSGGTDGWICTGGTYSGGTDLTELILSDQLTTYGDTGMGGRGGGGPEGGPGAVTPPEGGESSENGAPGGAPEGGGGQWGGGAPSGGGGAGEPPSGGTAPDT